MKTYLLSLLCCLTLSSIAQTPPDSTHRPNFATDTISFNSMGVTLAGLIYRPKNAKAAVVLVHGSGQETRSTPMASLLANNGIAVLTYDKRGVGKSGGVYAGPEVGTNNIDSANLNALALDASAAANTLLAHLPANPIPLGLLGFSQAGWIIPMAAQRNPKINFMVIFSGPVVTTLEQLRFQFYTEGKSNFWETHTETDARQHIQSDPDRYSFAATDPGKFLAKLSIKGLWLFGGKDVQIPVGLSIANLDALKARNKPFEHYIFPELGHNTSYTRSKEPFQMAMQWIDKFAKSAR